MFKIGDKVKRNSIRVHLNLDPEQIFTIIEISTYGTHPVLGLIDSRGNYLGFYYQEYLMLVSSDFVGPLHKYHTICTKVKEMQEKRKEKGYAF